MTAAGECSKHVAGDDRSVKGLDISVGSTARTLVGTSPIPGYGSPRCTVASPIDLLSASFQASVCDTPPEEHGRRMDQLPAGILERPLVWSRRGKHPSVPRQSLALPVTVSAHTATTTTITAHL